MKTFRNIAAVLAGICLTAVSCTKEVTSVSITPQNVFLEIGETYTLQATILPKGATFGTPVWSSDNASCVAVRDGLVSAIAPGSATVFATAGGISATCTVTVRPYPEPEPDPEPEPESEPEDI